MDDSLSLATHYVDPAKRVSIAHQNFRSDNDMLGATRSTIPSVLFTKESLLDPKQKIKTHEWSMLRTQSNHSSHTIEGRNWNTTENVFAKSGNNRNETKAMSSEPFLPKIVTPYSKTAEGARWKMTSGKERHRKSYSVLCRRSVNENELSTPTRMPKLKKVISIPARVRTARKLRNIKFWSEATPSRRLKRDTNQITNRKTIQTETAIQQNMPERTMEQQTWSEKFLAGGENTDKHNQFYARHIALRDRLITFETMHYREAITRINRYRKKLKKSTTVSKLQVAKRSGYEKANTEEEATEENNGKITKRENETSEHRPEQFSQHGIRLSPSKEWKPFVDKSQHDRKNEKQPHIYDKSRQRSRKRLTQPCDAHTSNRDNKLGKRNTMEDNVLNPINVKKLLRAPALTTKNEKNQSDFEKYQATDLSGIRTLIHKTIERKGIDITTASLIDSTQNADHECEQRSGKEKKNMEKESRDHNNKEANTANHTSVSAKLRLLLQKSSQSQRESKVLATDNRKWDLQEKSTSEVMQPRAGEKISRKTPEQNFIAKAATISRLTMTPRKDEKHLFMMRGINDKDMLKTQPQNQQKQRKSIEEMTKRDSYENQNTAHTVLLNTKSMIHGKKQLTNILADLIVQPHSNNSSWKPNSSMREIKTAISLPRGKIRPNRIQKAKSTKLQNCNNLVENATQQMFIQPEKEVEHATNTITANKQQALAAEPPATARKSTIQISSSQKKKMESKSMFLDPDKLAVTNLTAAILNSELALRAPSSSPVDFLRRFHQRHTTAERQSQTPKFQAYDIAGNYGTTTNKDDSPIKTEYETHINKADGLTSSNSNLLIEHAKLHLPKVSDLIDLQQLYLSKHNKHGRTASFQVHTSSLGTAQPFQRLDKAAIKKQHYYHYPYPNLMDNTKLKAPLYVVTGVKKVHKHSDGTSIKPRKDVNQVSRKNIQDDTGLKNTSESKAVYHSPFKDHPDYYGPSQNSPRQMKYQGYNGIRSIRVSMLKTPQALPLAQISEHSVD